MILYPQIDPVAFSIGPVKVHWYGIMYLVGFFAAWCLTTLRARRPGSGWTSDEIADVIFYCAIGVVVGGRIGYMLFYDLPNFLANPLTLFKVWQGGMSFHGGLLGVMAAIGLYAYRHRRTFFEISDFIAPVAPIGLGAGRIGNFINGELWGRVTTMPWGMVFPNGGPYPRHPSQLYEFFLEGVLLFTILWIYSAKPRPRMAVSGLFLFCYGCFRVFAECFRQPDIQIGFIAFGWLTKGQLLSIPMIIIGAGMLYYAYHRQKQITSNS